MLEMQGGRDYEIQGVEGKIRSNLLSLDFFERRVTNGKIVY